MPTNENVNIKNKRATFEYSIIDTYTAGMQLTGTEIKSVRQSKVNITDGFCTYMNNELWLINVHIAEYKEGTYNNHLAKRDRKLLLNRTELKKWQSKLKEQGLTIVPLKMFINERGFAKIDIALAKGKKIYDKREDLKLKDAKREMDKHIR
jgi:SsrA-binding protein